MMDGTGVHRRNGEGTGIEGPTVVLPACEERARHWVAMGGTEARAGVWVLIQSCVCVCFILKECGWKLGGPRPY